MMKNLMKIFENIREKRMNINKIWNNENFNNKILKEIFYLISIEQKQHSQMLYLNYLVKY